MTQIKIQIKQNYIKNNMNTYLPANNNPPSHTGRIPPAIRRQHLPTGFQHRISFFPHHRQDSPFPAIVPGKTNRTALHE